MGVLHNHLGQFDAAIKSLDESVRLNSDNIQAVLALGDSYEKTGDLPKAVETFKRIDAKEHKKVKDKLDELNAEIKRQKDLKARE